MIHYVLFEAVSNLIYKIDMDVSIVRINLTAALIYGHKHRLYAAGCLRHKRCRTSRSYGKARDIAATILRHGRIQLGISLFYSIDKRIILFTFRVIYFESTAFFRHRY